MTSPGLQRIFFDIDDTLFPTSDFARRARKNSIQALVDVGIDMDPEELYAELKEVIREFSSNYPYHYDKLLLRIPDDAMEGINEAIAVASAVIAYHRVKHEKLEPFPDVRRFFDLLAASSIPHKPGIITEGLSVKQAEKILRLDLYEYLDPQAIFISDKVGISKPNPKLFKTALRESNTPADAAMYVGDNPKNDVDPANEIGMVTVQIERGSKHAGKTSETDPDFKITKYRELAEILENDFDVDLPDF